MGLCVTKGLKKSKGLACFSYALRHGFATKKLVQGHDFLTVGELMGHANGAMVATVYSHIDKQEEHLKKAIN
jgi:site-specific recombinase XerD